MKKHIKNGLHVLIIMLSLQLLSSTIQSDIFEAIDRGDEKQVIEEAKKLTKVPYNKDGLNPLHFILKSNYTKKIDLISSILKNVNPELKKEMLLTSAQNKNKKIPIFYAIYCGSTINKIKKIISSTDDNELIVKMLLTKNNNKRTLLEEFKFHAGAYITKKELETLEEIYDYYLKLEPLLNIQNLLTLLKTKLVKLLHTVQALQK